MNKIDLFLNKADDLMNLFHLINYYKEQLTGLKLEAFKLMILLIAKDFENDEMSDEFEAICDKVLLEKLKEYKNEQ